MSLHRLYREVVGLLMAGLMAVAASPAAAQTERMYFPAVENVTNVLVQRINAETQRIDMSAWYLTEGAIVQALIGRHQAGVQIRLIGDRGSIFEIDTHTKNAFYQLAAAGVPIRLRYNPTWFPEIVHWKATIFVGQGVVAFGSANYTPFELAPASSTNYKDETVLFTNDIDLVRAFKTKFDRFWNDTTTEPESKVGGPPYFRNWDSACAAESACSDYKTLYPNPALMVIDTRRLEQDWPLLDNAGNVMVWGQGPSLNNRLVQEINDEFTRVDFVIYRLNVGNITQALLSKHQSGVPVRLIIEPNEYRNKKWPEFWLTHAYIDSLWAAGVPVKWRIHDGLTHMKMLVTSDYATNASSNFAASWERDHNYFVPAATKPAIYGAMRDRFQAMWTNTAGFANFVPEPPDAPSLVSPANGSDRRCDYRDADVEPGALRDELRRLYRHVLLDHDARGKRARAARAKPADYLFVPGVAAGGDDVLLAGGLTYQRVARCLVIRSELHHQRYRDATTLLVAAEPLGEPGHWCRGDHRQCGVLERCVHREGRRCRYLGKRRRIPLRVPVAERRRADRRPCDRRAEHRIPTPRPA